MILSESIFDFFHFCLLVPKKQNRCLSKLKATIEKYEQQVYGLYTIYYEIQCFLFVRILNQKFIPSNINMYKHNNTTNFVISLETKCILYQIPLLFIHCSCTKQKQTFIFVSFDYVCFPSFQKRKWCAKKTGENFVLSINVTYAYELGEEFLNFDINRIKICWSLNHTVSEVNISICTVK